MNKWVSCMSSVPIRLWNRAQGVTARSAYLYHTVKHERQENTEWKMRKNMLKRKMERIKCLQMRWLWLCYEMAECFSPDMLQRKEKLLNRETTGRLREGSPRPSPGASTQLPSARVAGQALISLFCHGILADNARKACNQGKKWGLYVSWKIRNMEWVTITDSL